MTLKILECGDTVALTKQVIANGTASVTITQSNDTLYATSANSYQWFVDGNIIYAATNSFYIPTTAGEYVVLITYGNGCSASDTIYFSIGLPAFNTTDPTICQKFCLDYFDQSTNNPTGWMWIFEGGSPATSSQKNPIQICYNTPGAYDVTPPHPR